ncbi:MULTISPECIES: DUF262 domain-containing protein [Streptomyces]|uniref:DUF262 domain-containing protein n=1 Tax=Streptomyces TaxID=1883 RepID=UPI001781F48E|nr:DUF262 domain-containing protein [Streptomyces sp. ME02-6978.2a]MDX3360708.1 DUF262 domain-containing protein [Streptomyces sp. ME02-6978.2a]GHE65128.1 hypothetical protein GCM10018782_44050 [Streptomyces griseoaurantiacus]
MSDYEDAGWDDLDGEENDASESVTSDDVTRAVVTDTDWTTETILSQLRRGNIQLNPRFQRRDAWNKPRKSKFIESLILGLPIPQIVLAEDKRRRGKFIVLDGKQRLLALRQFAAGSSFAAAEEEDGFKGFSLTGLEVREDLRLATLRKMEKEVDYIDDLNAFLNETIRTVVVRRWPNEDFLNLVFLRLNTGSVKLSPQELRQALHPGDFTDYLDDAASESECLRRALRIKKPDFRMRDVEVLLRYFAFQYKLEEYTGNLKRFLDDTVNELNERWDSGAQNIKQAGDNCNRAIETTFEVFGDNAFFRWSEGGYEGRFNRAVFDIMTYYFSSEKVRNAARENKDKVERAFQRLCDRNARFVESIQTTTKTPLATHRRLSLWGAELADALAIDIALPGFQENRIVL